MIVPINHVNKDLLQHFDCGTEELNVFLGRYALQNDKKNVGKTFVCIENDRITGFFTLSNAQINFKELSDEMQHGLPRYPIPCIRIARLAIDKEFQKKGYGKLLLKDAFGKIIDISDVTGICFVLVDAKESSYGFYEKYGFMRLNDSLTYILSVKTLQKAKGKDYVV